MKRLPVSNAGRAAAPKPWPPRSWFSVEQNCVCLCSITILAMRAALRLLANVKPGRFLEANNPTGLTGLFTHPSPRSTLIALYTETLDRLGTFPEHSAYRQSAEAITRHRLKIVDSVKPEGYKEWVKLTLEKLKAHPELFQGRASTDIGTSMSNGSITLLTNVVPETDDREIEWDGERVVATPEGVRTKDEKANLRFSGLGKRSLGVGSENVSWEPEPPLEATQ